MKHLEIFINLTRLNKPIGFMLLFWPCSWSLAYSYSFSQDLEIFLQYLILFLLGSILMRSAGCIFNDIADKDFDIKVKRTKNRPIASGRIKTNHAFIYVILLCGLAFIILLQFNFLTILLGLSSMFLAFSYPYMKRYTYWPQLFLGLTFNWGVIMSWAAIENHLTIEIFCLYVSAIFWTLGYDTIYGAQDMSDDEIIGVKSTAIKFKKSIKSFVALSYFLSAITLIIFLNKSIGLNLLTFLLMFFFISLVYQIKIFDIRSSEKCLKAFKINNLSGLILFVSFLTININ